MESWLDILGYQSDRPLIFTQVFFWFFFAVVLAGYSVLYPRRGLRNAYLFAVSLFFYYKTSGLFVLLLIFSTVTDYAIGLRMAASTRVLARKWWLALSIFLNLGVLVYFKYAYFFTDTFNALLHTDYQVYNHLAQWSNGFFGTAFRAEKILLPVGISFFTFQTMSYAMDVYRRQVTPVRNVLDFGFYVSFFPQLVAGPIVRASEFIPQLYKPYRLSRVAFGLAVFWILNGLLKKMFLADYLAVNFIDRVFSNPAAFSGFENLAALFGYSLQVYADFSGYTDIAIGVAALLGFALPLNFNSPYKARHVAEFWKRWHISLSTWLKDYLYIPMGGNRQGSLFSYIMVGVVLLFVLMFLRTWTAVLLTLGILGVLFLAHRLVPALRRHIDTNINLMLTMTIGGLWHGASWNMIIWGGLNGLGLILYKYWRRISPWKEDDRWPVRALSIALTLVFITFTRLWFRGESLDAAGLMLQRIVFAFHAGIIPQVLGSYGSVFGIMAFGYGVHWLPRRWKRGLRLRFARAPMTVQALAVLAVAILIYQVLTADLQPFIYFIF
jgi:alginate O-acetyltransferase complex protein AlgI